MIIVLKMEIIKKISVNYKNDKYEVKFMKFISKVIALILIGSFLLLMFKIYELNIIPANYFLIVSGVILFFVLILIFKLVRKKTTLFSRIFFDVVALLFITLFVYGYTYMNTIYNFMNGILSKEYEIKNYVVVVNQNSKAKKINDLNNQEIAYLASDNNYNSVKKRIEKTIKYKEKSYTSVDLFTKTIENNYNNALLIEEEYYNLLKEENTLTNTRVIKTYKIIIQKEIKKTNKDEETPFILYISGIDTYGKITSVSRSDVNILAFINPKKEKILLVSIPRDYYVKLHNTTGNQDKLTHAGIYGIDMSMSTINDLMDIDIDYYLRINFSTLTKSIDLIGGIDVYSDKTFTPESNKNIVIKEGINHMDGQMALAFARERYAYASGDRHRGQNQQAIIEAMINKMTDIENINKYKAVLTSLDGTFETSMSYEELTDLFKMQIAKRIKWDIESISLDGSGAMRPTYSMGSKNLYVMIPNIDSINSAKLKIDECMSN